MLTEAQIAELADLLGIIKSDSTSVRVVVKYPGGMIDTETPWLADALSAARRCAVLDEADLDSAVTKFTDEYGSQFLRVEGPDLEGKWHAEVVASGVRDACGKGDNPGAAIRAAVSEAMGQEGRTP